MNNTTLIQDQQGLINNVISKIVSSNIITDNRQHHCQQYSLIEWINSM